ncbi:hypothetical protein HYE11_03440 [Mycoplasmopsis bovis]|nr:hypothetical protein HYE11_03440 [Mycoplasmopsis bovis]
MHTYSKDLFHYLNKWEFHKKPIDDILINNPREILAFDEPRVYDSSKVSAEVVQLKKDLKLGLIIYLYPNKKVLKIYRN